MKVFPQQFYDSAGASDHVRAIILVLNGWIAEAAEKLEQDQDAVATAHLRGQIKLARRLLTELVPAPRPAAESQAKRPRLPDGMGVNLDVPYGMNL